MRSEDDLRAALRSLEGHAPDLEAVLSAVERSGAARRARQQGRHRRWLRIGAPILAALAVTAAVLVPLSVRTALRPGTPNVPSLPRHANPSARQVLDAAARVADAQPAQAGKYWRVSIASTKLIAGGTNAHPYALAETLSPWVTWYPAQPASPGDWYIAYSDASYTATPATAGAEAQWKADGSPALPSGKLPVVRTEAFSDLRFGSTRLKPLQFRSLPSNPAALKSEIVQMEAGSYQSGVTDQQSYDVFGVITDLLDHEPITPQVRAAAFRVLAGLPGIEMLGKVTDPIGRPGYAIGLAGFTAKTYGQNGLVGADLALVISPTAGTLLAEESIVQPRDVTAKKPAASGAVPGRTSCSSEFAMQPGGVAPLHPYTYGGLTYCVPNGATVKVFAGGDGTSDQVLWKVPHQSGAMGSAPLGPVVSASPGMVTGAYVILSEGWTNSAPSAAGSAQGIPSQ